MKNLLILSFMLISFLSRSQSGLDQDKKEIENVLFEMFEGMRTGDSARVSKVFIKEALFFTSKKNKQGVQVTEKGSLEYFLKAIGTPHEQIWNEKLFNTTIESEGGIAQVWTDYNFFIDDRFSHCGVDAFQLIKQDGQWKIVSIIDTRQIEGCSPNSK